MGVTAIFVPSHTPVSVVAYHMITVSTALHVQRHAHSNWWHHVPAENTLNSQLALHDCFYLY